MKRVYKKYLTIRLEGLDRFVLDYYTKKMINLSDAIALIRYHKGSFEYENPFAKKNTLDYSKEFCIGYTLKSNVVIKKKKTTVMLKPGSPQAWYRHNKTLKIAIHKNNNQVFYDSLEDNYLLKKDMIKLITDYDPETKELEFAPSGLTVKEAVPVYIGASVYYVKSVEEAETFGFIEEMQSGFFKTKGSKRKGNIKTYDKFSYPQFDKSNRSLMKKFGSWSPTYLITEGKQYTFGIELETVGGYVPYYVHKDLNIDCQYDGSIVSDDGRKASGGEYTTGVLRGDIGFKHLAKVMHELSRRCFVNNSCSVHVHIGNLPFTKEFMVYAYKLFKMIEDETFDMMPPSRRKREHCSPIDDLRLILKPRGIKYKVMIDRAYSRIIEILSCGQKPSRSINKGLNHPRGERCGFDRSTPRYWWVNFIPAVFNLKGKENYTIEIRNHSGTLDFEKVKNWTLIVMGIVSYIENNKRAIAKKNNITLREIMETEFPKTGGYLANYIDARKEHFRLSNMRTSQLHEVEEYMSAANETQKLLKMKEIILK